MERDVGGGEASSRASVETRCGEADLVEGEEDGGVAAPPAHLHLAPLLQHLLAVLQPAVNTCCHSFHCTKWFISKSWLKIKSRMCCYVGEIKSGAETMLDGGARDCEPECRTAGRWSRALWTPRPDPPPPARALKQQSKSWVFVFGFAFCFPLPKAISTH